MRVDDMAGSVYQALPSIMNNLPKSINLLLRK